MTINEMLEQNGFKKVGEYLIGKYKGLYSSVETTAGVTKLSVKFNIDGKKGEIIDKLDSYKDNSLIDEYSMSNKGMELVWSSSTTGELAKNIIDELFDMFPKLGVKNTCEACNTSLESDEVCFYNTNESPTLLCKKCAEKVFTAIEVTKKQKTNYILGFIGSLIGAIAGSIIWILLGMAGFYASIAGYAISFAAFYGYNFMKGKLTKIGVIINIITTTIAVFFAEYIGIFISLKKQYEDLTFMLYLHYTPVFYTDPEFLKSCTLSIVFGLVFAFLGCSRMIRSSFSSAGRIEKAHIEKIDL